MSGGLVMLAGEGDSTRIVYHRLAARFGVAAVILERPVPRWEFLKRRARKSGWPKVAGQVAFQAGVAPLLRRSAAGRLREIAAEYAFDAGPIPEAAIRRVESVNSPEARGELARLAPRAVVINGTRILSKATLDCVPARFLNMHAGITPLYRGVHGGYWALARGDAGACGVTVHRVDPGIDTGGILGQALIRPGAADNFATYPSLQLAAGLPILESAVERILSGADPATVDPPPGESRLWSHPTLLGYLATRFRAGIR